MKEAVVKKPTKGEKGFNRHRAARVLVEAQLTTDKAAAKAHGVSVSSVIGWRARLESDPELAGMFAAGLERADGAWRDELGLLVLESARKLRELVATAKNIGDMRDVLDVMRTSAETLVEYKALVVDVPAHNREGRAAPANATRARPDTATIQ